MNTVEVTPVASAALPMAQFRDHLRLGTGFGDDSLQNGVLEACLRAALARVEGYCGKAVLARDFVLTVGEWRELSRQVLPMAPVSAVSRFAITDRAGAETVIEPAQYRLIRDATAPMVISAGYALPRIPLAGHAAFTFTAGFGDWDAVPGDMAQAVLILAASLYEGRGGDGGAMPVAVSGLLSQFRTLRLLGGGRA
ncbi:head-tail connector protein [Oceaniglobus ichthyenteri]|uniref:head-tail connector protein n=1 Tax=Oceaniglobus ichthyenteri TaxID=2136177 RepID=UPI000D3D62C9|nr:hypothetical protein [Oceaniglobus ichthyenteri]